MNSRLGTITLEDGVEALDKRDYWDNPLATREERDALLAELAELRRKAAAWDRLHSYGPDARLWPAMFGATHSDEGEPLPGWE